MLITHINFAKGYRGGERQTQLLIEELSQRGYKQKIITRDISELADNLQGLKNTQTIKIPKPYIFNISKVKNSDILHAHETKAAQFCFFANLIYKIPYIITRRVDNPIKNNFFNKAMYENSSKTVVLSNAIKKETLKISIDINTDTIPSSYSKFETNKKTIEKIQNRFKDKFLIGHIGALDNKHKGQSYLIEAMKKVEKIYPDIHLILLGRGDDELWLKEQTKDMTNITFEGFVQNVGDYIKAFDMFVFPSLNEGLGSILFDVIQGGVPIAASNVGGIVDIIQHNKNGILFEVKNSQAIFEVIQRLYNSKDLREKLSFEAYKSIENFSCEVMTNRYINMYKSIKIEKN